MSTEVKRRERERKIGRTNIKCKRGWKERKQEMAG